MKQCVVTPTCFDLQYTDHLQGVTERQYNMYRNRDGIINILTSVQKQKSADIIKFVCSCVELVHKMRSLYIYWLLQNFLAYV
jgi:hypothetical protein